MIITKTPFRMSFFGGGTDMEEYFKEYGGAVLSTTIDKFCYVNVRHLPRFFDYSTELAYSKTERVKDVNEIEHPLIRNAMKMLDMHEIRLTYEADLPARSGLGTSSSFAVGTLLAFYALKGKYADKKKLADEAIYLERELCDEAGGWQDQIAAAYGGFNKIVFNKDGYEVKPVIVSPERKKQLNDNILMFFTGFTRFSSDVQRVNNETSIEEKRAKLNKMYKMVEKAEYLNGKRWNGTQYHYNYNDKLDYINEYKEGKRGRMKEMKDLMYIPFCFDNEGATIIHYSPETYEPRSEEE